MGQRSQIYFRHNGNLLIANYYRWNFAERMISRARWGIEWIKEQIDEGYDFVWRTPHYIRQLSRVFDANFDMHDVQISSDIFKEHAEDFSDAPFNDFVFNQQDNNDGQLFVDIRDGKILYCFRDMYENTIMDAAQYMEWDAEEWQNKEHLDDSEKAVCKENIKAIGEMAQLMTREQLDDFLNGDYEEKPFN